jgi:hypothetical protein
MGRITGNGHCVKGDKGDSCRQLLEGFLFRLENHRINSVAQIEGGNLSFKCRSAATAVDTHFRDLQIFLADSTLATSLALQFI